MRCSFLRFFWLPLLFCVSSAWAQADLKIGVVNLDRILKESAPAQRAQKRIEAEVSKREQEMSKLAEQIKRLQEKSDKDGLTLSDSERNRREAELREITRDFQRKQREAREDINQRRNEELSQVLERANKVVRQIAESEKFDIILQEAVYANSRIDITEKVVRAMDDSKQSGGK
ncbi:MAG TPA: OmpH family outer membrane protein [Burkholderiales bacterium]|nr:OmpH family outer membrane protein [Burkholderiales bacterium]